MAFAAEKPLFGKGMFSIDPNSTPEQLAARRALMAMIQPKYGSAKYVGEGLGQLATGVVSGLQNKRMRGIEGENTARASSIFAGLLGGAGASEIAGQQPMNILGANPNYGGPNDPEQIGADAMSAIGKDPGSMIKQGLVARGMPEHIADGFVMNFKDESGLNPGINEQDPTVAGSRGGFGLAQWTGPRRRALEAYAGSQGKPVSDMNVQLDFLMQELQGPEAAAWQDISASPDAGAAGAAIVNSFLRPAEEHRARREAAYMGGGQGGPTQNPATPQIPPDQLIAALSNPWLSQEQRGMLQQVLDQQVAAGDPMKALELEKAQLELAQLKNPQADPMADIELQTAQLKLDNLKSGEPIGATEYGTTPVLGRNANGDIVLMQIGKDGSAIETKLPEGVKADLGLAPMVKAEGSAIGKAAGEADVAADSLESKMAGLEVVVAQLDTLADQATYTAAGQALDYGRKQLGLDPRDSAVARAEYIATVDNQVLPLLRDTFGAAFTVKEGETLRATLGDPNKSPAEKKAVLRAFIEQKKRDLLALQQQAGNGGLGTVPQFDDDAAYLKSLGLE